jgi:conjugal transfer mating pair stabilization protein TraG
MPTFEIYSIGDINYLELVLNALAAFSNASGNLPITFFGLVKLGLLIGVFITVLRGFLSGRIRFQDMLLAIIITWVMFIPKVTVVIQDMYTGSVKVVANVPIGPAAVGSFISRIGYSITEVFETAFSLPNSVPITQGGFMDPLDALIKARKSFMQHLGQANSPVAGSDVKKSFVNYIKDCTLTGVALGQKTMDDIERNPSVMDGIKFEHEGFGTQLFLGATPEELTCTQAYSRLNTFVSNTWITALRKKLAADFAINESQVDNLIQRSLDALTDGAVSAQEFMLTAAILPFFEEAIPAYHLDELKFASAQMVQQAILQRNTQWAAQYSVFERYVRPMLTFIEGFSYAISPMVIFALTLGTLALRVVSMYLMLNLWIQLWMPILAIINLYIQMAAGKQMAALSDTVTQQYLYPSIAGVLQSDWILQDWLGVGGLLASSAPALAFMVLSGSAVAITHMVSRLEGGDAINEKIVSPDIVQPQPVLATSPAYSYAPLQGTAVYGTQQNLPSIDIGNLYQAQEAFANQRMRETSRQFMEQVNRLVSHSSSTSVSSGDVHSFAQSIKTSKSRVDGWVRQTGEEIADRFGLSSKETEAVMGAVGLALRGGRSLVSKLLDASLKNQHGTTDEKISAIASAISERFSDETRLSTDLAEAVSSDYQRNIQSVVSTGWKAEEIQQLSEQASRVLRASESWTQTKQLGERFGVSGQYSVLNVSRAIAGNQELMGDLAGFVNSMGLKQQVTELSHRLQTGYGLSKDQAYAAAGVMTLTGYSGAPLPEDQRIEAMRRGYMVVGRAMEGNLSAGIAPMPSRPEAPNTNVLNRGKFENQFWNTMRQGKSAANAYVPGKEAVLNANEAYHRESQRGGEDFRREVDEKRRQQELQAQEEFEKKISIAEGIHDLGKGAEELFSTVVNKAGEVRKGAEEKVKESWKDAEKFFKDHERDFWPD